MGIRSLLMREIIPESDKTRRWLAIFIYAYAIPIGGLPIWKFLSMDLTAPQRFFGILVCVAMMLQFIGYGLLTPLGDRKDHSKYYYASPGQLALYVASILVLILGVWKLASMAITEYELILGLMLLFELMLTLLGAAQILSVVQAAREQNREKQEVCS